MGNTACGGPRVKPKKAFKTQLKLQELMSPVTLQVFESKIKMFASDGLLSVRQLDEILLSGLRPVRTKNNQLLRDILTNPFFHASKDGDDQNDDKEASKEPGDASESPKDDGEKGAGDGEEKPEEEGGEADAASPDDGNEEKEVNIEEDEAEESIVSETATQVDFQKFNKQQREQKDHFQPATTVKAKPSTEQTEDVTQDTFLCVDKLVLFAILYMESVVGNHFGNQAKALAFYHLMQQDDIVGNVKKSSKRMKKLMYCLFELSQARLRTDPDGKQRIYFREAAAGGTEETHKLLISWLYQEYQRQIFGRRDDMSCIMFIERIACAHNKNRNPNDQDLAAMFPKNKKNKAKKEEKEDDARSGLLSPGDEFEGLNLPQLQSMGVNDWFDPVHTQKRIEILRKYNAVEDEAESVSAESLTISERE